MRPQRDVKIKKIERIDWERKVDCCSYPTGGN